MNTAMELHDSRVLQFTRSPDGTGDLLFRGYTYCSAGTPGKHLPQTSGWQNIRMRFTGMNFIGEILDNKAYVSEGHLWMNEKQDAGLITFPIDFLGTVRPLIATSNDFAVREIRANSISICCEGDFEPESFWHEDGTVTPAT